MVAWSTSAKNARIAREEAQRATNHKTNLAKRLVTIPTQTAHVMPSTLMSATCPLPALSAPPASTPPPPPLFPLRPAVTAGADAPISRDKASPLPGVVFLVDRGSAVAAGIEGVAAPVLPSPIIVTTSLGDDTSAEARRLLALGDTRGDGKDVQEEHVKPVDYVQHG